MCGVLGMVSSSSRDEHGVEEQCAAATAALRHRGPDDHGQYREGNVWLAHRRLSILDLTAAGRQPMQSRSGRFVIVYNGEVYNFRELARSHGLDGLRSGSDTEVILRLFESHQGHSYLRLGMAVRAVKFPESLV